MNIVQIAEKINKRNAGRRKSCNWNWILSTVTEAVVLRIKEQNNYFLYEILTENKDRYSLFSFGSIPKENKMTIGQAAVLVAAEMSLFKEEWKIVPQDKRILIGKIDADASALHWF